MGQIIDIGTQAGKYKIGQNQIKHFVNSLFANSGIDIERLISVFDNSEIKTRFISAPIEWYSEEHNFKDRNLIHNESALGLTIQAVEKCIKRTGITVQDIDHIIFVNSTGISTPTIDSFLINHFRFRNNVRRTPIWGLGCAAGVVGLSRAFEYLKAYPEHNCLLAASELCSLTFQKDDISKSNIIASSLFSDGAAAVMIAGDNSKYRNVRGLNFVDNLSTLYYDSPDVMGWDIVNNGFKVRFSRDIPTIVKTYLRDSITELLDRNGLKINQLEYYITHPGGLKVIQAFVDALELDHCKLELSKKVLANYGNMSSVSVLFVLEEFLRTTKIEENKYGLFTSLGPGFSSELILFKT